MRSAALREKLCEEHLVSVSRVTGGWFAESLLQPPTDDSVTYCALAAKRAVAEDLCLDALAAPTDTPDEYERGRRAGIASVYDSQGGVIYPPTDTPETVPTNTMVLTDRVTGKETHYVFVTLADHTAALAAAHAAGYDEAMKKAIAVANAVADKAEQKWNKDLGVYNEGAAIACGEIVVALNRASVPHAG